MANAYQVQVIATLLQGSSTERTKSETGSGSLSEDFWITAKVAAGASEVSLALSTLTLPKQVVVFGDVGVWYKHTTGASTQKTYCDPYSIEAKSTGLDFSTIYLGNDSASEVEVTVVAIE